MTVQHIDDFNQAKMISTLSKRPVKVNDQWIVWHDIAMTYTTALALVGKFSGATVGTNSTDILYNEYSVLREQLPEVMRPNEKWTDNYFYNRKLDKDFSNSMNWFTSMKSRIAWKNENAMPTDLLKVFLEQVYIQ
jgi:hypothetical protein